MKSPWPRRILLGTVVLLIGLATWWALREQPAQVDTAAAVEAPMRVTIREQGKTRVRDIYAVSAPIAGHLARTALQEGERVEAGKTVVAAIHPLDPPLIDRRTEAELRAARDAARSAVEVAASELRRVETALSLAEDQLARSSRLVDPGVISESALQRVTNEVEIQKAAVEAARATVEFRQAELASVEARLSQPQVNGMEDAECCVMLRAPISGTVLSVHVRSEQAVMAGAVIAEIGDTSNLEIVVELLSSDAVQIAPGTAARIVDWGGEGALPAAVRRVDPAAFTKVSALGIEEQRVNAVLDLDESDFRLGHGFRVIAELIVWECEKCLQVPISALFRVGDQWRLFSLAEGQVHETAVQIGRMNDEMAEVLSGVAAGDRVVVHPADTLFDGAPAMQREQVVR